MELTLLLCKILGPLLILRGLSILIDRQHFVRMLDNLEREIDTVSFSMVPVFLFVAFGTLCIVHWDFSSVPAALVTLMAIGGTVKSSVLILFPGVAVAKARQLGRHGFLHVVWITSTLVGLLFTWYGWLGPTQ